MFRPLTAVSLVLALATTASAQDYAVDQGSLVLGGTVSFTSEGGDLNENADGDRANSLLLNPSVLYFVTPGLGIGGDLYVEYASQGDFSATAIGVGPEVAYFFGGPDSSVYPFVAGTISYVSLSSDFFDASGIGFGLSAGAAFMLTQSVALTAQADYEISNVTFEQTDNTESGNTFRLAMGIAAFLF